MGATVAITQVYGAGPSQATVDNGANPLRLCNADAHDPGLANPLVIHASGVGNINYSYWVHLCLDLSGTYTRINNVRLYSDGSVGWALGTSGGFVIGLRDAGDNGVPLATDYEQAAGSGDTGYFMHDAANGHDYFKGQTAEPAPVENYTSGSPLTIDSTNHDGAAEDTKAAVVQIAVDGDATHGELADEVLTFVWDEI